MKYTYIFLLAGELIVIHAVSLEEAYEKVPPGAQLIDQYTPFTWSY